MIKLIKESDDKITAKSFQELISKLEDHGYSCEHYYDMKYPESNWLYITKNGDPYEAEFYRYSDGEYELYLHNIHPTKEKNEGCYNMKSRKGAKNMKLMKESHSDIDSSNVWEAYDIASEYLGWEGLCDSLAKGMGTDKLVFLLGEIFKDWEIPFMDDEEFEEEDYDLDIDEGCHGRKTKKKSRKLKEDSSERYGRYLVKISRYKNMYKLDYIDEHWDKSNYCFFDENGYLDTDYSGISRDLFDKIYDRSMKPGHVYEVYTDGPYGDIIGFEEVPYGWFR